jgi:hypothetical protein
VLRWYALATLVVVLVGAALTAHHFLMGETKLASVRVAVSPRADARAERGPRRVPASGFRMQGPAVLSTVPDCVIQEKLIRGPRAFVDSQLPRAREHVPPGSRLTVGACTILVRTGDLLVMRGDDTLRVSPNARLFTISNGLLVDVDEGRVVEARLYRRSTGLMQR